MKAILLVALLGVACGGGTPGAPSSGAEPPRTRVFVHPGLINTRAELDRIKAAVNGSAAHPMKAGWNVLRSTSQASLSYRATPFAIVHVEGSGSTGEENALRNDAVAAYAHALQWVVTGDAAHAQKAIQILDAWSAMLQDIVPTAGSPGVQDELEAAWYAPMWLAAAEILRDYGASGWTAAQQQPFDARMVALFQTKAMAWAGSTGCCPNQGISVALSRMSIGVYRDDRATFDSGLRHVRDTMLPRAISSDGEVLELNRTAGGDCGHAAYNIEGLFDAAEIAWHQGVDLYDHRLAGDASPRLAMGLEGLSQCILSGVGTSQVGFVRCGSQKLNSVEIAFNHYANRRGGVALPQTTALLATLRPTNQGTSKFIPWDTLTHAELR